MPAAPGFRDSHVSLTGALSAIRSRTVPRAAAGTTRPQGATTYWAIRTPSTGAAGKPPPDNMKVPRQDRRSTRHLVPRIRHTEQLLQARLAQEVRKHGTAVKRILASIQAHRMSHPARCMKRPRGPTTTHSDRTRAWMGSHRRS